MEYLRHLRACSAASNRISFAADVGLLQSVHFAAAHAFSLWKDSKEAVDSVTPECNVHVETEAKRSL